MVKTLIKIAMFVSMTSAANAAYHCSVSAENPQRPGEYTISLSVRNLDLADGKPEFLYMTKSNVVSVQKLNSGKLQLASSNKYKAKINAAAVGADGDLYLIDGKNNWSIICVKY